MPELHKKGKVILRDGKYFLVTPGKEEQIGPGAQIDPAQLKTLAGQEVELVYSEPASFVVGLIAPVSATLHHPIHITCYIPAVLNIGQINEASRATLAKQLLNEGVLSKENYERLTGAGK
jgi:hypothetical protein